MCTLIVAAFNRFFADLAKETPEFFDEIKTGEFTLQQFLT